MSVRWLPPRPGAGMIDIRPLVLVAALLFSPLMRAGDGDSLQAQIAVADGRLFAAVFDDCDAGAVSAMITDDFEFFHDKWGQIAKSREEFVKAIQGGCDRQKAGTDSGQGEDSCRTRSSSTP